MERIYDDPEHKGYRVLADRIWPRGITKERAALDEWCKDLAPSTDLRKWFNHDVQKWPEFSKIYIEELKKTQEDVIGLIKRSEKKSLILLSGTKDKEHTHTIILKKFISSLS